MADQEALIQELLIPHSESVRESVALLRQLIHSSAPNLTEEAKMGWKNIVYKKKGIVVAVAPQRQYVQLFFYKGINLADPAKLLEGTGKGLRHIKIRQPDDVTRHKDALVAMIHEAIQLDGT